MRSLVAAALILAAVAPARGDGGPAMTLRIAFRAGDPHSLYVVSNYGVLISHDDGCTMSWVCEQNVDYGGYYITKLAVADDGAIFATSFNGLRVSRDGGCSFTTATATLPEGDPGRFAGLFVDSVEIGPTGEVWTATGTTGETNDVFVSHDNGETFEPRGLASQTILWKTLRVAPSDPERVYVSGIESPGQAHLLRRDGAAWTASPLAGVQLGSSAVLVVAAIDPHDRDLLYVVSEASAPGGADRLYRSRDGGATLAEVLSPGTPIRDVVVRDTGAVIVTTTVQMGPTTVGGPAFESTDGGSSFHPFAGAPALMCLGVAPDGALVGCGANWAPDFKAIARQDRDAWTKVWRFVELAGPLACPAGTGGHELCDPRWDALDKNLITSGPSCGAHAPDAGPPGIEPPPPPPEGCCDAGQRPTTLVWAIAIVWWLRRRR